MRMSMFRDFRMYIVNYDCFLLLFLIFLRRSKASANLGWGDDGRLLIGSRHQMKDSIWSMVNCRRRQRKMVVNLVTSSSNNANRSGSNTQQWK